MSTPQWETFLNLLQQRGTVPEKLVRHLRKQLRSRQPPPSARSVAGWLVDHGHLTRFQAQELLKAVETAEEPRPKTPPAAKGHTPPSSLPEANPAPGRAESAFPSPPAAPASGGGPALLDDLEALDAAGPAELGPAAAAPGVPAPAWGAARVRRSVWESPLFLLGGGGLILLVVIAAGLYWAIGRESADQLLQSAEEDYNNGSYTLAIEKFERFLDYFPDHTRAGHVRVLRGLAIMRRAVDQGSDWEKTLQIIEQAVKEIRKEKEFPEARPELAAMLPRVAEGLTDMAESQQSPQLLEKARRVYQMILNPNYVPDKLRNRTRLATLEGRFLQIERMLGRNRRLSEALQQIRLAIDQKQTQQAYQIRRQLLKEYPELETNPQLQEAIAQATGAERRAIRYQPVDKPAAAPAPKLGSRTLPVAHTQGKTIPEAKNHLLFVTAAGALWAVSAEDGKLRWRQYLGKDLWLSPVVLSDQAPPDVVAWSPQHRQLWRLQGKDGSLRWHLPLPQEPVADLVLAQGRLYVPLADQLWEIQAEDGQVLGRYEFPQALSAPAALAGSLMFLPAGHSNVYVLDLEKRQCVGAYYLGHEQNTIVTPGIVAGPFVILAENTGQRSSRLRVLRFDAKKHTMQLVQSVRLQGQVFRPPVLRGRMLAVATDLGQIVLFEVNPQPQKKKEPLSSVASRAAVYEEPGPVQILLEGTRAWVADRRLTRYRIQAAQGQMNPDRVLLENVSFPLPLHKLGEALFAVAQEEDGTVRVAAFHATSGLEIWTTRFAMPMSWTPLRGGQDPAGLPGVVDPRGNVYQPRWPSSEGTVVVSPVWSPENGRQLAGALPRVWLPLGLGVWAGRVPGGARRLPILRRGQSPPWKLLWHELPQALLIPPVPWQGKLLLASRSGPLFVMDAVQGRMVGSPYFPPTVPGHPPPWLEVGATDGRSLLLAAGDGRLLLFDKLPGPNEALLPLRQAKAPGPLHGPVVLFHRAAWLWDAQGRLVRVSLPELKLAVQKAPEKKKNQAAPDPGRPVWGPVFCGADRVLCLTRDGKLLCLSQERLLWQRELSGQLPVGEPVRLNRRECLLAIASGKVLQLELDTGALRHTYRTAEALAGSPLLLKDNRLLIPTPGGAFHMLEPRKTEKAEAPATRTSRR